jgi:hypothetical protein
MSAGARTLLKVLVEQRHWRYVDFERHFQRAAPQVLDDARGLTVSEAQFRRWTSGRVKTLPGSDTCQVLEAMFGIEAAALFGPPPSCDAPAPTFNLEDEIAMTARDAHSEAAAAAAAAVSDTALDQLRDDLTTLARQYTTIPTYVVFQKAKELRELAETQRERTQVPAQQQELLIVAGQACALLATAAFDLGSLDGAKRLTRSAALYGETARFDPLRAFAGGTLAYIAYWTGQPAEAARLARAAQMFTGLGDVARHRLAAIEARAHGHLRDHTAARRALAISQEEGRGDRDVLHDDIGGEFGFSLERLTMSNATTYLLLDDGQNAEEAACRALDLVGSRPAADQSCHVIGNAGADLAAARLLRGELDGAAQALERVWQVPTEQRGTALLIRTAGVRRALTAARFSGSPLAADLGERIEDFSRQSAPHQLGTGTGSLAALEG